MHMKFEDLKYKLMDRPFFETQEAVILSGQPERQVLPRISRWVSQGKLIQLRRGKYVLAPRYQQRAPDHFYISNYLYRPSFVSLYTALQYYQCIPEEVHVIQGVTTRQTAAWGTGMGRFQYFSTTPNRFFGYSKVIMGNGEQQSALIADLERALIDVCYFSSGEWTTSRWLELRLQNCELINIKKLLEYTGLMESRKLECSIHQLIEFLNNRE